MINTSPNAQARAKKAARAKARAINAALNLSKINAANANLQNPFGLGPPPPPFFQSPYLPQNPFRPVGSRSISPLGPPPPPFFQSPYLPQNPSQFNPQLINQPGWFINPPLNPNPPFNPPLNPPLNPLLNPPLNPPLNPLLNPNSPLLVRPQPFGLSRRSSSPPFGLTRRSSSPPFGYGLTRRSSSSDCYPDPLTLSGGLNRKRSKRRLSI